MKETGTNPTREITSTAKRGVQPAVKEAQAARAAAQAVWEEAREDRAEVVELVAVEVEVWEQAVEAEVEAVAVEVEVEVAAVAVEDLETVAVAAVV
jgi:hypothetical protein